MPSQGDEKEVEELAPRKFSKDMDEKHLSNIVVEVEWKSNATCNEVSIGD
jgi:hypothetical protein